MNQASQRTKLQNKKVGEEIKKKVKEDPFLFLLNNDPLSIPSLIKLSATMKKELRFMEKLTEAQEKEFVLSEAIHALNAMNILVPDIDMYEDDCDPERKALIGMVREISFMLGGVVQRLEQETKSKLLNINNYTGGMRRRAGSQGPQGIVVGQRPYYPQQMYPQELYPRMARAAAQTHVELAEGAGRIYEARTNSVIRRITSTGNMLKALLFLLGGTVVFFIGSQLVGDRLYAYGVNSGQSLHNFCMLANQRIQFVVQFGKKPEGAQATADLRLMQAFHRYNQTISVEGRNAALAEIESDIRIYRDVIFQNLNTKRSSSQDEMGKAKSRLLNLPCFRELERVLETVTTRITELEPKLSSSLQRFLGQSREDIEHSGLVKKREHLNRLIVLRNEGMFFDFLNFLKTVDLPEIKQYATAIRPDVIEGFLARYSTLDGKENEFIDAFRDAVKERRSSPLAAFEAKLPSQPAIAAGAANAAGLAIASGNNAAVNADGTTTVRNAPARARPNVSSESLTPEENTLYQYLAYDELVRFINSLMTKVNERVGRAQAIITRHSTNLFLNDVNYYYETAADAAESAFTICTSTAGSICSNAKRERVDEVKESIKYLVLHGAPNKPPPESVLIPLIAEIYSNAEYERLSFDEYQNEIYYRYARENPRLEVRALFAIIAGILGLGVYEGAKRVVKIPGNIVNILYLLTAIPAQSLQNTFTRLRNQEDVPPQLRNLADQAIADGEDDQDGGVPPLPALPPGGYAAAGMMALAPMAPGMGPMAPMAPMGQQYYMDPQYAAYLQQRYQQNAMAALPGYGQAPPPPRGRQAAVANGPAVNGPAANGSRALVPSGRRAVSRARAQQRRAAAAAGEGPEGAPILAGNAADANAAAANLLRGLREPEGGRRRVRKSKTSKKHKGAKKQKSTRKH